MTAKKGDFESSGIVTVVTAVTIVWNNTPLGTRYADREETTGGLGVVLDLLGHVVVDHVLHVREVQPLACDDGIVCGTDKRKCHSQTTVAIGGRPQRGCVRHKQRKGGTKEHVLTSTTFTRSKYSQYSYSFWVGVGVRVNPLKRSKIAATSLCHHTQG